jgi:prepilin-type N-terminal cleavage/methylation domain-containing protein
MNQVPFPHRPNQKGFTLTEVMVVCTITGIALVLCTTAVMGFRVQTQTTLLQLHTRLQSQKAIEHVGRQIMQSTKVEVEGDPVREEPQFVHVWHDNQLVWTPGRTDDDTEGIIYLHEDTQELRYCPDNSRQEQYEVMTTNVEKVKFLLSGKALFIEIEMRYDPRFAGSERKLLASFVVRNNPKIRQGASQ